MVQLIIYFFLDLFEALLALILCIRFSLPNLDTAAERILKASRIEYYDVQKKLIDATGDKLKPIEIELVPQTVINALIATEDKNFFNHQGMDYKSLLKNLYLNLLNKNIIAGGSTISQQLAKNILQNEKLFKINDRSALRKIKEALLTFELEKKYDKNKILYLYLNRIFFGKNCYGIEAAAKHYFNKSATALNIYEAAMLIGLLQSPSKYSGNREAWKKRGQIVLYRMKRLNLITEEEEKGFENFKLENNEKEESNTKYFTNYVYQQIPEELKNRDLKVYTTMDLELYEAANKSLNETQEENGSDWNSDAGSIVILGKNGGIAVLIGGLNYSESNFNIATQGKRPTGSTAKYFVYLTAIEMGLNPQSEIDDRPYELGEWKPSNHLHYAQGKITIENAFAQSVNSAAIRIIDAVTPEKTVQTIKKLGIEDQIKANQALALGGLNASLLKMCQSFLPIINKGYMPKIHCILKITDTKTGEILYQQEEDYEKVIDQRTAYYMWQVMKKTFSKQGTARNVQTKKQIFGGKTGTSNESRDLYLILANADYVIGSWFGRRDYAPMKAQSPNLCISAINKLLTSLKSNEKEPEFELGIDDINTKTILDIILND